MNNTLRIIYILLLFFALLSCGDRQAIASERIIEKIWFEKISIDEEKVFFKLGEYCPPDIFGLGGDKGRLVCDFFDTAIRKEIPGTIETDGNLILRIRIGPHLRPIQKIRVVLDLVSIEEDYSVSQYFYANNIFVISVNKKQPQ